MPQRAKVGSLEAIEAFRANLLVFSAQARSALEEISGEVLRTRIWIEDDQRVNWDREMRRRSRALEEAQASLFSARISKFSSAVALQQLAVHRARRAVEEGDSKIRVLKKWSRDFEGTVQPLLKQVEKLHTILSNDLVKATAELSRASTTLRAYAEMKPPPLPDASPLPASGESDGPTSTPKP